MLTVRTFARRIGVTEATIRKKLKMMSNIKTNSNGRYQLNEETYALFLYNFYPKMYAKDSHNKVVVHKRGHKDTMMIYKVYGMATENIKSVFKKMSNF